MTPLISFVDENDLHYINWDAKVNYFIDQDSKELNLSLIASLLPSNVLADIKLVPISSSPIEDMLIWGFSHDSSFTLKLATWVMIKP